MFRCLKVALLICFLTTPVFAQNTSDVDVLPDFKDNSRAVLNDILRRTNRRVMLLEGGIPLTTGVTGILPLANGGTGVDYVDPNADRIWFWDDSEGKLNNLTVGTGLTISGTTITTTLPTSNVIFSWSGMGAVSSAQGGFYTGSATVPNNDLGDTASQNFFMYRDEGATGVALRFRFTKIAGISTVTIHSRLWAQDTNGANEAVLTVDIGGQNNTVKSVTSATPTWVTTSDIDVSGLSDGTTYDGVITLTNEASNRAAYCSAVTLIGS